jgi:hypothetical protein
MLLCVSLVLAQQDTSKANYAGLRVCLLQLMSSAVIAGAGHRDC